MTHDDAPAERDERDELREKLRHLTRDPGPLGSAVCALLNAAEAEVPVMVKPDESRAILALLAQREAPSDFASSLMQGRETFIARRDVCSNKHSPHCSGCNCARTAGCSDPPGAAPQEAPICLQCIERAEQEIAAGHYYRADELMAALRERREPVCACGETHPDRTPLAAARPAPEMEREPELLGYVVERQRTPGKWVRVWTGRTLWFDHDEAVLERDAYALDGIPARIRPVYLGAPAPEEATEARDAMDFCPTCKHPRWTAACQCAPASGEPSGAEAAVREAWRSVTDSLPKPGADVIAGYRDTAGWRCVRAVYAAARSVVCTCERDGDCLCDMDDTGESWWPEGWYEIADNCEADINVWCIEGTVTHWMPLPQAPTAPGEEEGESDG